METFSSCWADEDKPYLQALNDTPGHLETGHCFCDTDDDTVLSQVLNDYDRETADFFRWEVRYDRDYISRLIKDRSRINIGRLESLVPLERGFSGRIVRIMMKGSEGSLVVGKELEIRKLLSESHLKSSAFEPEYLDSEGCKVASDEDWTVLRLEGRGWGHGVGLCQIGAAVMASEGYGYEEILKHYYPGTELC